ncbi:MAG: hypothetical protein AVDCRST_MAG15-2334 [uncultured Rubellimicrobium sp.]|uniref:Uncharacterized protein n=1 Tax=uncultured Rubellimicrobium sp. TaxID=543078 RepID=A0A6J4PSD8_9RHOB|nr:MAG: hypothetical protein AVDCRST_MAG15-2334 [uncultured Rubellimicrobium sp.]
MILKGDIGRHPGQERQQPRKARARGAASAREEGIEPEPVAPAGAEGFWQKAGIGLVGQGDGLPESRRRSRRAARGLPRRIAPVAAPMEQPTIRTGSSRGRSASQTPR